MDPLTGMPQLMRASDIAGLAQLHLEVVQRKIREGYFPGAFKLGSRWRIPREDVVAFLHGEKAS